ncbi:hypothetical protein AUP68_11412 [Ilyonectria robusta]
MGTALLTRSLFSTRMKGRRFFASATHSMLPAVIRPSRAEIEGLTLNSRNLEIAVRHMHEDGLVVVEDVVPHEHLDFLNWKMVHDAQVLQDRGENGPFNYNKGNIQQDAPPVAEYFFSSIFASTSHPLGTPLWESSHAIEHT